MRLETSKGNGIEHDQDSDFKQVSDTVNAKYKAKNTQITIRTKESIAYNCHGMTFASRRAWIVKNTALNLILEDDNYREVENIKDVLMGDIIIYYSEKGDPNHSGMVVSTEPYYNPMICSKWGNAGEFLHRMNEHPQMYGPNYKFYRCHL